MLTCDIQLNKGTINDRFGRIGTNNGASFSQKEKGLAIDTGNTKYVVYDRQLLPTSSFSVVIWFRLTTNPANGNTQFIGPSNGANTIPLISTWSATTIMLYMGTNFLRTFNFTPDNKWHCLVITQSGNNITNSAMYLDGVSLSIGGTTSTGSESARTAWTYVGGAQVLGGGLMSRIKVYDTVLTIDEVNKEQIEFNNAQPINKPKRGFILNKPNDSRNQVNSVLAADSLANWNFLSGWTTTGISTIIDSNSFSTSGVGGIYKQSQMGVVGDTYLIRIKGTTTSSGLTVNDGGGSTYFALPLGDFDVVRTITWVGDRQLFLRQTISGTTDIEILTLQKSTGLWAHYNFQKIGTTLVDISGNGNNLVATSGNVSTKTGIATNGTNSSLQSAAVINYNSTTRLTIAFKSYIEFNSIAKVLIESSADYNSNINCYSIGLSSTNKINFGIKMGANYGAYISNNSFTSGVYDIVITIDTNIAGASFIELYVNGILEAKTVVADTFIRGTSFSNYVLYIASRAGTSLFAKTDIADLKIYNRALSLQEIKDYHNQFVLPTLVETFADEGADGLSKVPREWEKVSGSFAIKEIAISNTEHIVGGPNFSTNVGWNLAVGQTISDGVYTGTTGGLNYCTSALTLVAGKRYKVEVNILTTNGLGKVYVGGKQTGVLPLGRSVRYIVMDTVSNQLVGFNDLIGTSNYLSITEVPALDTLPNGAKYMECLSQGVIAIPNTTAYGSWEFDFYKGVAFSDVQISLTSITNTGGLLVAAQSYALRFFPNSQNIFFYRANAAILNTAASYFTINTWYRLKVTRTSSGVFTILIKGGAFTPTVGYDGWTLLSVLGGSGTNPITDNTYTSSIYSVIGLGGSDRIANFISRDGIKQ
jgi:hypothetical protein